MRCWPVRVRRRSSRRAPPWPTPGRSTIKPRLDWDRAQELFKNDDISKAQYDQYRMRLDSTTAVLRQAEEQSALVVEGPRKEDIEAARAQVAARPGRGAGRAKRIGWS